MKQRRHRARAAVVRGGVPDRDRGADVTASEHLERVGETGRDRLRDRGRAAAIGARQAAAELVTTQPTDASLGSDCAQRGAGDQAEHVVSHLAPEAAVDLLQVDHTNDHESRASVVGLEGGGELELEPAAQGHAGLLVEAGQPRHGVPERGAGEHEPGEAREAPGVLDLAQREAMVAAALVEAHELRRLPVRENRHHE
jgi:hypothetical protein